MSYGDAKIRDPWGDGRDASVKDELCELRPCLSVGEDKGVFAPGRGYVKYYEKPELVCLTRHCHGCPRPIPEPEPERARCCRAPDLPKWRRKHPPAFQSCRRCKTRVAGKRLEYLRTLPVLPIVDCAHYGAEHRRMVPLRAVWRCPSCGACWERKPEPYEPGDSLEAVLRARGDDPGVLPPFKIENP